MRAIVPNCTGLHSNSVQDLLSVVYSKYSTEVDTLQLGKKLVRNSKVYEESLEKIDHIFNLYFSSYNNYCNLQYQIIKYLHEIEKNCEYNLKNGGKKILLYFFGKKMTHEISILFLLTTSHKKSVTK